MPDPNDRPAQGDAETARASAAAEDVIWVARCLRGDSQAFERLVTKHQRVLFTVAFRLLGDYEDARDATQNAFIRAYTKLDTFDPSRRFFSWIYRIAVNECLNLRRTRRPHEPLQGSLEATGAGDPVEARESSERVRAALLTLTQEQREVVVLRYYADLSYGEMSEAIGVPEKTVKSRLFSARQKLGTQLSMSEAHES
jgi:RNA polymerase sigma-70 factor, ECF subfamily